MSHCAAYGENFKDCVGYPTYCDNRCFMYQRVSAEEVGKAMRKLIDTLAVLSDQKGGNKSE